MINLDLIMNLILQNKNIMRVNTKILINYGWEMFVN